MIGLPHGLAEPLHINEPFPTWKLVAAGLGLWLLYRLLRYLRRKLASKAAPAPPPIPPPPVLGGIAGLVDEIRRLYEDDYRRGCHALAAALRRDLSRSGTRGSKTWHPYSTLTAREIGERVGDGAVARLFALLAELQFYRREPTRSDFDAACELTVEVAGASRGRSR